MKDATLWAFVATVDGERAKKFYRDVIGLRLVEDTPFALVFDANGTPLRVQKVHALVPHGFTALGWGVQDLEAAMASLTPHGVVFKRYDFLKQDDRGVWTSPNGAKIVWFEDPDGNTLSLTELQ